MGGAGYHQYTQPGGNIADLTSLGALVAEGKLKAVVDKTFAFELEDVKAAFRYQMTGRAQGKVVVVMNEV